MALSLAECLGQAIARQDNKGFIVQGHGLSDHKNTLHVASHLLAHLQMWLAGEGVPMPLTELIQTTGVGNNKYVVEKVAGP